MKQRTNQELKELGLDTGEASVCIALSNGIITVTHGTDGSVLFEGPAPQGTWNTMLNYLEMVGIRRPR